MQQKIVAFFLRAQQSEVVFKALLDLRDGSEWSQLDATQKRIVEKRILDAELDGARLEGERREEFNSIVKELSEHSLKFNNNVLDATNAFAIDITEKTDVAGLSDSVLALCATAYNTAHAKTSAQEKPSATASEGPWRVTLEAAIFIPFMEKL